MSNICICVKCLELYVEALCKQMAGNMWPGTPEWVENCVVFMTAISIVSQGG